MNRNKFESILISELLSSNYYQAWTVNDVSLILNKINLKPVKRTVERWIASIQWLDSSNKISNQTNSNDVKVLKNVFQSLVYHARKKRITTLFVKLNSLNVDNHKKFILVAVDGKNSKRWCLLKDNSYKNIIKGLKSLSNNKSTIFFPTSDLLASFNIIKKEIRKKKNLLCFDIQTGHFKKYEPLTTTNSQGKNMYKDNSSLTHLNRLEAESIHIMREVVAYANNPVMLYSIGKDSAVMLHLAQKAFYPSPPPFPLLHVDTRWKFQDMYKFRDQVTKSSGMELIVHINQDGVEKNINPFDHGSNLHTDIMKTQSLKQALDLNKYDIAFGGARRDEEKSRAKERVFSFRNSSHSWDPKNQRPEIWNLYNCRKSKNESIRVFPLSNWTELDIWQYIYRENIQIVPLYFASERPVVNRNGMLIMVDDERMELLPEEIIEIKKVRFRTLGCYPLTGAVESNATDLSHIILELLQSKTSERQGRAIDSDSNSSMELKKREGYF